MAWPLPRPWSETMVSIPLWAQKTREIKGFLGLERPFLDLVSRTPRPRGRGRPLFAESFEAICNFKGYFYFLTRLRLFLKVLKKTLQNKVKNNPLRLFSTSKVLFSLARLFLKKASKDSFGRIWGRWALGLRSCLPGTDPIPGLRPEIGKNGENIGLGLPQKLGKRSRNIGKWPQIPMFTHFRAIFPIFRLFFRIFGGKPNPISSWPKLLQIITWNIFFGIFLWSFSSFLNELPLKTIFVKRFFVIIFAVMVLFLFFFLFRAGGPKWGLYQANRIATCGSKNKNLARNEPQGFFEGGFNRKNQKWGYFLWASEIILIFWCIF